MQAFTWMCVVKADEMGPPPTDVGPEMGPGTHHERTGRDKAQAYISRLMPHAANFA